jgi:exodeoxyribonuclease V beta subunit
MAGGDVSGEIAAEAVQVRLESDADAVVLTTIHKSKGLQYPVVFVPYLWQARSLSNVDKAMPRYRDAQLGRCVYVGGEPKTPAHGMATDLLGEEEMRLAYVAVTRAQSATFIVVTDADEVGESPLGRMLNDVTRAGLLEVAAASPGDVAVEDLVESKNSWKRAGGSVALVEPPATRRIVPTWRVSSFSGLTRRGDEITAQEEEGIDRDRVAVLVQSADVAGDGAELAALAGGVRVGLMVHAVFERFDFQVSDPADLRKLVGEVVQSYRVATGQVEAVCGIVEQAIRATLPGRAGEFRLADVARSRRLDELEFILPVSGSDASRLTPAAIADVLAAHGAPAADPGYAERVRGLGFGAFAGFLRGYIDMVFERDGQWYVVDYKSNFLGTHRGDYAPQKLLAPMRQHDYFLQYLLYVVATDRYLARRLPGYSYERDFGGVFYLFLRGMAPDALASGIFHDRPGAPLVADLSRLFAEGPDGA